jgi:hypothetical protein
MTHQAGDSGGFWIPSIAGAGALTAHRRALLDWCGQMQTLIESLLGEFHVERSGYGSGLFNGAGWSGSQ